MKKFLHLGVFALLTSFSLFTAQAEEELVKVTFAVPAEGVLSKKVSQEAQGDNPEIVYQPAADGQSYMLPKGKEVLFELVPDEENGYYVAQWRFDNIPFAYSSYLNSIYKVPYEGMRLDVEMANKSEFFIITYTAPQGTMIRCQNKSDAYHNIASGDSIQKAENVIFMISPESNPDGKVNLKHWLVNGRIMVDAMDEPITDNTIEFKVLEDLDITAVVAEGGAVESVTSNPEFTVTTTDNLLIINTETDSKISLISVNGSEVLSTRAVDSALQIPTGHLEKGIYVVTDGHNYKKVLIK